MMGYLCHVKFNGTDKPYVYKTFLTDLIPGDNVIVETRNGWTKAIFVDYIKETNIACLKFVVAYVDPETIKAMSEE